MAGETPAVEQSEGLVARWAAMAAVALGCLAVGIVLLASGDGYRVTAHFQTAGQLHEGNLVQASGKKVGVVKEIELTDDGLAAVTMELDQGFAPLREGTQATVRQSSQSSAAGRYVDLALAPASSPEIADGGEIPMRSTTTAVDIDQLFGLFDRRTRRGLTNFIRGSAAQYQGMGEETNAGWRYLNPSLIASARL